MKSIQVNVELFFIFLDCEFQKRISFHEWNLLILSITTVLMYLECDCLVKTQNSSVQCDEGILNETGFQ